MKKAIRDFFNRIKVYRESQETIHAINDFNMHYGTFAAVMLFVVGAVVLLRTDPDASNADSRYGATYVLLAACLFFFYVAYRWFVQKKTQPVFPTMAVLFLNSSLMICEWCVAASHLELVEKFILGGTILIFVVCFPIVNRLSALCCLLLGYVAFLAGLPGEDHSNRMVLLIGLYVLVLFAIGSSRYVNFRTDVARNAYFKNLSLYDELTGLRNRTAYRVDGEHYLGKRIMVMMLDIDDFKHFNDYFGHQVGDKLLVEFASALRHCFGGRNAYRYGGDEFCVLFPVKDQADVNNILTAWTNEEARAQLSVENSRITSSCGYVLGTPQTRVDLSNMLAEADQMLYQAKNNGKNFVSGKEYEGIQTEEGRSILERRMVTAASIDSLTGLMNMHAFREYASERQSDLEPEDREHLVYIDVENFKGFNQKYGYQSGDELLRSIAISIKDTFPKTIISRFHDDQFVLITEAEDLDARLEQLHEHVHRYQKDIRIELKSGICRMDRVSDISLLFDHAKAACQSIKGKKNISIRYYDDALSATLERQTYILDHFEDAMQKGYLQPFFQNLVRAVSGKVFGVEVLARWIDPEYGFIPPSEFVPVLESAHVVDRLDLYIMREACRLMKVAEEQGVRGLPLSINLSKLDFRLRDMYESIEEIRKEYGFDPGRIHIEVTESVMAGDTSFYINNLSRFRESGYEIWMDDFGSEYSSLNNLKDYHFDTLKIDMQFMREFSAKENSRIILSSIVDMAKRLEIRTVTEGVETREQYEFLRDIGCDIIQGYYFDKPHDAETIKKQYDADPGIHETPEEAQSFHVLENINFLGGDPLDDKDSERKNMVPFVFLRRDRINDPTSSHIIYESRAYMDKLRQLRETGGEEQGKSFSELSPEELEEAERLTQACFKDHQVHTYKYDGSKGQMQVRLRLLDGDGVTRPAIFMIVYEWNFLNDED
ncbi:MAG: bifunctional diguanylate cyclase/phosphodiesterase [Lachnospiraceae bacterium]|nr:bifunctional diguanylate cyclase/phosphodiesterase [Lachnospiraceae bacterium]